MTFFFVLILLVAFSQANSLVISIFHPLPHTAPLHRFILSAISVHRVAWTLFIETSCLYYRSFANTATPQVGCWSHSFLLDPRRPPELSRPSTSAQKQVPTSALSILCLFGRALTTYPVAKYLEQSTTPIQQSTSTLTSGDPRIPSFYRPVSPHLRLSPKLQHRLP